MPTAASNIIQAKITVFLCELSPQQSYKGTALR